MQLVAIDNGYDSTKVWTQNKYFSFKSRFEKANDTLNNNNTMNFRYADEDYLVGEGATMDNLELDKCSNELHRICTYTSLAKLSNYMGTEFNIVVGYPLNIYSANKDSFANYLKTQDFIETQLNYEIKVFKVNQCIVFPQGAGALYVNPERYKNKIIAIVDIGGLTINGCIFDNLNLIRKSIFTETLGSKILFNKVKKALESKLGMNIQEYEMPSILKHGLKKYTEESMKIKNEVLFNHIDELKRIMRVNNWNYENLDILLVGGGSLLLEECLKKVFPQSIISEDPIYDNAKGFHVIGRMMFGE
jgi:plasmid segregation protein ParM